MKIKKFKSFQESISGTELVGHMGPNYGEWVSPNTISSADTEVIHSEITDKIYTKDDYDEVYQEYLKKGGTPLHGFNKQNLDNILHFLKINI